MTFLSPKQQCQNTEEFIQIQKNQASSIFIRHLTIQLELQYKTMRHTTENKCEPQPRSVSLNLNPTFYTATHHWVLASEG